MSSGEVVENRNKDGSEASGIKNTNSVIILIALIESSTGWEEK